MIRHNVNPETIRMALRPDFPAWRQAFDAYRRHKPYGNRPAQLLVNVSATPGLLQCKAQHCRRRSEVPSGIRVVESCPLCGSWETAWISEPAWERVRVTGTRGGIADPYTGRDYCLDLERWAECVAYEAFRSVDGAAILELHGLYDLGATRIASALRVCGRGASASGVKRVLRTLRLRWEIGASGPGP